MSASASISLPVWTAEDFQWQYPSRSFEFRVDNISLAQWFSGHVAVGSDTLNDKVSCMFHTLAILVTQCCWRLRWTHGDWVQWIPRERNSFADSLANFAIDRYSSFCYYAESIGIQEDANYVIVSDGAYRKSTNQAAAGWAIFSFQSSRVVLCAAGGRVLDSVVDSFEAEVNGLELAIQGFRSFSRGELCEYATTLDFEDLPDKVWSCLNL